MKFLTLACAIAALLLLALVSSIWFLRAASVPQDHAPVLIEVAGQGLRIDPAFVRRRSDLLHRQHDEFELVAALPGFEPAAERLAQFEPEAIIVLSIRGKDARLEPAEKPARLYARFLKEEEELIADGLVARRFETGSPYEGEVLIMTPPEGRIFWARCLPASMTVPAQTGCMSEMRIKAFDVAFRFSAAQLQRWSFFGPRMQALLQEMSD